MDSNERAQLRSFANGIKACYYIGKDGVTDSVIAGIEEALVPRELIKVGVQENCPVSAREACGLVAEALGAEPVQVIGRKFVIYRRNKEINQYGI
ncbi:MAG: YhbY family RNA-binding protein [Oscillospiraceae bacterium]|nr:YhbY family RNA-binding protein [Oscillospiraceae bacterium]